jgi:hypothetical protein
MHRPNRPDPAQLHAMQLPTLRGLRLSVAHRRRMHRPNRPDPALRTSLLHHAMQRPAPRGHQTRNEGPPSTAGLPRTTDSFGKESGRELKGLLLKGVSISIDPPSAAGLPRTTRLNLIAGRTNARGHRPPRHSVLLRTWGLNLCLKQSTIANVALPGPPLLFRFKAIPSAGNVRSQNTSSPPCQLPPSTVDPNTARAIPDGTPARSPRRGISYFSATQRQTPKLRAGAVLSALQRQTLWR